MLKSQFGTAIVDGFLQHDVGYAIEDLKKTFTTEEEYKVFVDVLKESLGEFLMDVYASTEKNVTIEDLFLRLKKIAERRFDEV